MSVTLHTEFGDIKLTDLPSQVVCSLTGTMVVSIWSPGAQDIIRGVFQPSIRLGGKHAYTREDVPEVRLLLGWAEQLTGLLEDGNKQAVALAQERLIHKREQQELAREQQEQLTRERTEQVLFEFVGEKIKVRLKGYKGSPRATFKAVEETRYVRNAVGTNMIEGTGKFTPRIVFDNEDVDGGRPRTVDMIRKLEVKQGSRYVTIWDDGEDDLPLYKRNGGQ